MRNSRRERKAREEARRREFTLAVGGSEQLERLVADRLELWFREQGGKPAPPNAFGHQAKTFARDLASGWIHATDEATPPAGQYVEQEVARLIATLESSKALRLFLRGG